MLPGRSPAPPQEWRSGARWAAVKGAEWKSGKEGGDRRLDAGPGTRRWAPERHPRERLEVKSEAETPIWEDDVPYGVWSGLDDKGVSMMKAGQMKIWVSLVTGLVVACTAVALAGCGKGEPGVQELWEKSEAAEKNITSLHMEVAIYYQNTKFGGGQIQTTSIDVSGNNVHSTSAIFGQSFSEIIVVGGKQYVRSAGSEEWKEQPATISGSAASEQLEGFSRLPEVASSSQNLGLEKIGGVDAYHLSFTLSPNEVSSLFKNVQAEQLASNTGGKVDVWVEKDSGYRVKYEAVVNNALITDKIGYGDIRIVTTLSSINQPISITPPV